MGDGVIKKVETRGEPPPVKRTDG
uniref:Uncharacterized protein n=1 Tax=Rhizophora mucronata TaxID=61149 RepID=A0A2P2K4V5_RHIMU